jgi:hypothetical protein
MDTKLKQIAKALASAGTVLAVCLAMGPRATAADRTPDVNGRSATVIAHLALPGPPASQMLLRSQNGKEYLYLDQGKQEISVVDVSNPRQPKLINRAAWPQQVAAGQLQLIGSGLAISENPQNQPALKAPENINILDLTNPAQPQVLAHFSGVTSVLPDNARNLVFLANANGLWIVHQRVTQKEYAREHECTSAAETNPMPDCY